MRFPILDAKIFEFAVILVALGCTVSESGCVSVHSNDDPMKRTVTLIKWDLDSHSVTSAMTSDTPDDSVSRLNSYYLKAQMSGERIASLKLVLRHSAFRFAALKRAYDDQGRPLRTEARKISRGSNPVANAVDSTLGGGASTDSSFEELQITLDLDYVESRANRGLEAVVYGDHGNVVARIDPQYVLDFLKTVHLRQMNPG